MSWLIAGGRGAGNTVRPPLNVLIPLGAITLTGVIGVSFGLSNLFVYDNIGHTMVLIWASGLTVSIMAVAVALTMKDMRSNDGDHD